MQLYRWQRVHAQILHETFAAADRTRGVALVGILSEFVIVYSDALRRVVEPVEHCTPEQAPVLTPEYAARLLAHLYSLDAKQLLRLYTQRWHRLKASALVRTLCSELAQHRFVARLVPAPDLP